MAVHDLFDPHADTTAASQVFSAIRTPAPLGPSDSSDSASDTIGQDLSGDGDPTEPVDVATGPESRRPATDIEPGAAADTDAAGTGERRSAGNDAGAQDSNDVSPDRVFDDPTVASDGSEDDDPDDGLLRGNDRSAPA